MLDMYDFNNDIWLCHSTGGKCYNFTAFVSTYIPSILMVLDSTLICIYFKGDSSSNMLIKQF